MGIIQKVNQKHISILLGVFWLIDSIFQMQPKMFTSEFANKVIEPFSLNQPAFLTYLMHHVINLFLIDPIFFNTIFIIIQLSIAILILNRRTTNIGLKISIGWGLLVWILGEGMGGLFSGKALIMFGFPGAALIYALIAIALVCSNLFDHSPKILNLKWLNEFWMILWMSGALFLLYETMGKTKMMVSMIKNMTEGAPGWLYSFNISIANSIDKINYLVFILIAVYIFIGLSPYLSKKWSYIGLVIAIFINILFFVIGQNIGGYYSGLMTDLNSSPLLIFMAVILIVIRSNRPKNSLIEF